jgi:hypothetical protein
MSARESTNHTYFYDALSGGVQPPSDPEGRTHTLGRLLNATVANGDKKNRGTHNELHSYRPSWAPISSIVRISHWDIRSLRLASVDSELEFIHTLEGKQRRNLRVLDNGNRVIDEPIGHEFGYFDLQERVRVIAQDFFNAFPAPEVITVPE